MESAGKRSPSTAVVRAVARSEGQTPDELDERLYAVVDPDALDALYERGSGPTVEFEYCGYDVTVSGDGEVDLEP